MRTEVVHPDEAAQWSPAYHAAVSWMRLVVRQALAQWVCFPHAWQSMRCVESIRQLHRKNLNAEPLTWEQLLIQHGEREALELLRIGEVKKVQVAWSQIPRYVRISGQETLYLDRGSTIETERPCTNFLTLFFQNQTT